MRNLILLKRNQNQILFIKLQKISKKTQKRDNNEENSIGQLWNEIWEKYHVSLNWAFSHYFNYLSIFTVEDIMKIKPGNFEMSIEISL